MSSNEVVKVEKVFVKNKETGETFELNPIEVFNAMATVQDETICCDDCEHEKECTREALEDVAVGSSLRCIDDELCLVYLDEYNNEIAKTNLMPNIVNVQQPNDRTVFVEFADGDKQIAHLNDGDVFNLETGILICIAKKLFEDMDIIGTGSSAYNKVIKYALGKRDYTKKARQAVLQHRKEERMKLAQIKQDVRRAENKKREERIREMTEAYKRAINDVSSQALKELEESFKGFIDELEKNTNK